MIALLIISFLLLMYDMPGWALLVLGVGLVSSGSNNNGASSITGGNPVINLDWVQNSENGACSKVRSHHREFIDDGDGRP